MNLDNCLLLSWLLQGGVACGALTAYGCKRERRAALWLLLPALLALGALAATWLQIEKFAGAGPSAAMPVLLNMAVTAGLLALWLGLLRWLRSGDGSCLKRAVLQAEEACFRVAPVGLMRTDRSGLCLQVNNQWSQLSGLTEEEAQGTGWELALHPADHEWVLTRCHADLAAGQTFAMSFRVQRADGRLSWIHAQSAPCAIEGEAMHAWTDITQAKLHEFAIQESEQRLRRFLYEMPLLMVALDGREQIAEVNPGFEQLCGFTRDALRDETLDRLLPDYRHYAQPEAPLPIGTVDAADWECELICRDGSRRIVAWWLMTRRLPMPGWHAWLIGQDVTHLRQGQRELRDSMQRLQSIMEHTPLAVIEWDLHHCVRHWSLRAEEIFGWKAEEIIGQTDVIGQLVPEAERPLVKRLQQELQSGAMAHNTSINRNLHKHGRTLYCEWHNSALYDSQGHIYAYFSLVLDVTERNLAESELKTSRQLLQASLDSLRAHVAVLDETGAIMLTNLAWRRFAQSNDGQAECYGIGVNYLQVCEGVVGEDQAQARSIAHAIRDLLAGERSDFTAEYPCHAPDQQRWFQVRISRFELEGQTRLLLTHEEISEMRLVQEALRQSEERARRMVEMIPDGLCVQQDGRYVFMNERCAAMLGAARAIDLLGTEVLPRIHPRDRELVRQRIEIMQGLGQTVPPLEQIYVRLDGSTCEAEVAATSILWEGRPASLVIMRDITERKRQHQTLLTASRMEATATLAGGIAHDFNNLMVSVLGNAELLRMRRRDVDSGEDTQMLEHICAAAQRAGDLAQQMLAYARGGKYQPHPMNLNMTIEEVLQLQQRSLPPRIHLETRLDPDLRMILADGTQMMQVLMNLGINAMEAIPQHGRIVIETRNCQLDESAELRAQGARSGPGVCVRVADTGSGMPPETLEKIFEPFFSTKFTGRGLGLAAVYGIIKNHDGFILVHSRMGEGSEFLLYFPAYGGLAAGSVLPAADAPPAVAEPEKARATVLVIDDEMMVLEITAKLLGRLGYQALGAPGSQQALEIVRHHPGPIHAILLDLGMPGMGGAELFPLLRRERPSARILICSGYELESEAKPLIKQGAVGFVQKPYSLNDLGPALRKALDSEPADVAAATPQVAEESK